MRKAATFAFALGALIVPSVLGSTASAQGVGGPRPDLAFEGLGGQVEILAEQRLERAAKLMKGVGAMLPRNSVTGLAGAGEPAGMSGWMATGGVHLASRVPGTQHSGDSFNGVVGIDMALAPWFVLGVSGGFEARDLDTFFNSGKLQSTGGTIAPYFIARLDENFYIDGTFSYTRIANDLERSDFFGGIVFGEYTSNRYAGAINFHGVWNIDNWRLGAQVGYLHVHQDDNAYTETGACESFFLCRNVPGHSGDLGQARWGGRVGYAFGEFVPYIIGRLEYDVVKPSSFGISLNDRFGGFVGAGLRWNIMRTVTAVAHGNTIVGRDGQTNYGGYATIRFSW